MSSTQNMNFQQLPATGAVEWPVVINDMQNKIEAGRTLKLTAGENLVVGNAFYVKSDGKAWKADDTTGCDGVWQSTSTLSGAEGFGQIDGTITTGSWTPGGSIYPDAPAGALTQTQPSSLPPPVGYALSSTVMVIQPQRA